jgi:hypothetical protein
MVSRCSFDNGGCSTNIVWLPRIVYDPREDLVVWDAHRKKRRNRVALAPFTSYAMTESKLKYRKNQGPNIDYSFCTCKRKQFYMCEKEGDGYSKDSNEESKKNLAIKK